MKIKTMKNLAEYIGVSAPFSATRFSKRLFKDTNCGASISIRTADGWHHNGDDTDLSGKRLLGFTVQTIVEGSDATVDSDEFAPGVDSKDVDKFIKYMEDEADVLWQEVNEELDEDERLEANRLKS